MARVRLNEGGIRRFLSDPFGPVARMLGELGEKAANVARATVQVQRTYTGGRVRRGTSAAPGSTLASITAELHTGPEGYVPWEEVSSDMVGLFLERGTRPHRIHSLGPWSLMNYATGYFGPEVFHPGARPYPFLTVGLDSLYGEV